MPDLLSAFGDSRKRGHKATPFFESFGTGGEDDTLWNRITHGKFAGMVKGALDSAVSGATYPGDVYAGKAAPDDVGRAMDTAGLAMAGAAPSALLDEVPGMTLNSGLRLPPVREIYHSTGSPEKFDRVVAPKPSIDLGIHGTWEPGVSRFYERRSDRRWDPTVQDPEGIRTYPLLADTRKTLAAKVPIGDAIKWNDGLGVMNAFGDIHPESAASWGLPRDPIPGTIAAAPGLKPIMDQLRELAYKGTTSDWRDNFIPILKKGGFDSIAYKHSNPLESRYSRDPRSNTLMLFDNEQAVPRFSAEGEKLISERGFRPANKKGYFDINNNSQEYEDMLNEYLDHYGSLHGEFPKSPLLHEDLGHWNTAIASQTGADGLPGKQVINQYHPGQAPNPTWKEPGWDYQSPSVVSKLPPELMTKEELEMYAPPKTNLPSMVKDAPLGVPFPIPDAAPPISWLQEQAMTPEGHWFNPGHGELRYNSTDDMVKPPLEKQGNLAKEYAYKSITGKKMPHENAVGELGPDILKFYTNKAKILGWWK